MLKFQKIGKVFEWVKPNKWWHSHTMAPSAISLNEKTIRIFLGCWDKNRISRVGFIDVDSVNPAIITSICEKPVLDIGGNGTFDENGVFPGHASKLNGRTILFYTGFQSGKKIPYYNFGGLAVFNIKEGVFKRVSNAPVLDRADEGLFVRAGQSVIYDNGLFKSCYSAGSGWMDVGGKKRPVYDVCYQESDSLYKWGDKGKMIVECNIKTEHGLGRPQLIKIHESYYVFYTRRIRNMKYFFGYAKSDDCKKWKRMDNTINIGHTPGSFDSQMVYFPSVVYSHKANKHFMFYSGNNFGKSGIGVAEILIK